jgi:hypothetical protein
VWRRCDPEDCLERTSHSFEGPIRCAGVCESFEVDAWTNGVFNLPEKRLADCCRWRMTQCKVAYLSYTIP